MRKPSDGAVDCRGGENGGFPRFYWRNRTKPFRFSRCGRSNRSPVQRLSIAPVFWIGGIAAALLLLFTLGGYAWQRLSLHNLAADHLRLVVTGPAKLAAGVPNQYSITTTSVAGDPLPVKVAYAVYSPAGKSLWQQQARTNSAGRLNVTIPASLPITGAARLEVLAYHHDSTERMQTFVPTEQRRFVSQLALDKPLYQPGETVFYRSLTLGRFGLDVPEEMPFHFEIHDPSGAAVAGSELEGVTERGVGSGGVFAA